MSGPRFTPEITVGNILSILSILLVGGMAWGNLDNRVNSLEEQVIKIVERAESRDARLRAAETAAARADERVALILQSLGRIEARLERFEERIRENATP